MSLGLLPSITGDVVKIMEGSSSLRFLVEFLFEEEAYFDLLISKTAEAAILVLSAQIL